MSTKFYELAVIPSYLLAYIINTVLVIGRIHIDEKGLSLRQVNLVTAQIIWLYANGYIRMKYDDHNSKASPDKLLDIEKSNNSDEEVDGTSDQRTVNAVLCLFVHDYCSSVQALDVINKIASDYKESSSNDQILSYGEPIIANIKVIGISSLESEADCWKDEANTPQMTLGAYQPPFCDTNLHTLSRLIQIRRELSIKNIPLIRSLYDILTRLPKSDKIISMVLNVGSELIKWRISDIARLKNKPLKVFLLEVDPAA